jgi:hypothetical protein
MPGFLQPSSPHTHNALDDAIEQGELFANLLEWATRQRSTAGDPQHGAENEPSWLTSRSLRIA